MVSVGGVASYKAMYTSAVKKKKEREGMDMVLSNEQYIICVSCDKNKHTMLSEHIVKTQRDPGKWGLKERIPGEGDA